MNNRKNAPVEGVTVDLTELVRILFQNIIIIVLTAVTFGLAVMVCSKAFMGATYQSTTKLYVLSQQSENTLTNSDVMLSASLSQDYSEIFKSRDVVETVIAKLGLNINYDQFKARLSVSNNSSSDSRMLFITIEEGDPYLARDMAQTLVEIASEHIKDVVGEDSIRIVENANIPISKTSPRIKLLGVIGGALGFMVAIIVIVLVSVLNDTIKTQEDIEKYLGISVLGQIPISESVSTKKGKRTKKRKAKVRGKRA